jgi:N4-gp56 family major capsid protein
MADRHTSTATNDNLLSTYFERRLIKNLKEKVWFYQLATKFPLPKMEGTSITFNGWAKLGAASATLGEGSANAAVNLSSRKVTASIASYGRSVKITDLLELTSIAPPVQAAVEELGHAAALTLDNVVQLAIFKSVLAQVGQNSAAKAGILSAWMSATASAFCANTGGAPTTSNKQFGFPAVFGTSATRLSAVSKTAPSISARLGPIAVRKAVTTLRRKSAEPMADGTYAAVASPQALATLMGNPDYKQYIVNYAEGPRESMWKHEVTKLHKVRFMESPNAPRYAVTAHSVNPTFICGKGAVGVTELDGGIKMLVKRPGAQTTSDPYDLNSTVAFKLRAVAAALNVSAGVILFTHEAV